MIPYQPFADHLQSIGVLASPSELHAQASAALCVNQDTPYESWREQMLQEYCVEHPEDDQFNQIMSAVFEYAKEQLQKDNFSYQLLLPQDNTALADRVAVLAEWVSTFLAGLGTAGMIEASLSNAGQEFLQDMTQIARIDQDVEEVSGEELDFMEIIEYVRTGVMVLFAEINAVPVPSNSIN
ncbi:UPF0149 family protein [Marinicella meishanensis]|uniref:UPF0149 family protein n=1 Tax=Marinicella meishanensis TaxID=2873263 RepID=UPI001CC03AC9|nr:UPF0149 family protein [Marinicella sp. NBU2979]